MTESVDIVGMLQKGRGKWGDGETHAAKYNFTAEEIKEFTPKPSDEQLKEIANAPVDDKWVKSPKKVEDMITNHFASK
jgi:hypothetical protein